MERLILSEKSYILMGLIPFEVNFEEIYKLKPLKKDFIKTFGKTVELPRYHRGFINDYKLPGDMITIQGDILSKDLQRLFDYANSLGVALFNQSLVNFYDNGESYIGFHRDTGTNCVFSASFGENRTFRITDQKTRLIVRDLIMNNNTFLIMCGDFQNEFFHEILRDSTVNKRLNVTFREI